MTMQPQQSQPVAKISERLMTVKLSMSRWYPRKFDKRASEDVARMHGSASADEIGRFNKILVSMASIKPLRARMDQLREDHYAMTVPWQDGGTRALPVDLYWSYREMVREATEEIERLADDYAYNEYAEERERARVRLNGLFNPEDYPSASELRARFSVRVHYEPIANADDVRVWGLGDEAAEQIRADVMAEQSRAVEAAHRHVIDSLIERAREFVEKTRRYHASVQSGARSAYHETAITNLRDICDVVLSGLNVTGDPELTKAAADLRSLIDGLTADDIRAEPVQREAKAAQVAAAVSKLDGIFGGAS